MLKFEIFIIRPVKDELYTKKTSKNIVVLRKGNLYIFDMLDRDGKSGL